MTQSAARRGGMFSARALSGYARIVSSGASTAAAGLRSAGASIVSSLAGSDDDAARDQVNWAAFDKLELSNNLLRQVLLLAYTSGFEVWDVEQAEDLRQLTYRNDGPVVLMQVLKTPIASKRKEDRFNNVRPVLAVACDEASTIKEPIHENGKFPTILRFYSLQSNNYVHELKFRSAIFSIRSGPRVLAVAQASQIHCFDAATMERECNFLTNPIPSEVSTPGAIGHGPLAMGSRWLAYSGTPVVVQDTRRVSPQLLTVASDTPSTLSRSTVVYYAKESSKQLAASIATLGDMGYKKLTKYCSEIMPNSTGTTKLGNFGPKANGITNGHFIDNEFAGMVIVRDIVSKLIVVQFRAHMSPISALCFDPSETLLVTASIHGHNINVYRIIPSPNQTISDSGLHGSYVHLYKLQRGITNAVIKDISFSGNSEWIMISSSRGTSHLFAISSYGGTVRFKYNNGNTASDNFMAGPNFKRVVNMSQTSMSPSLHKKTLLMSDTPATVAVVSRIRNGNSLLKDAVNGVASFATGSLNPISGAIASAFHNSRGTGPYVDTDSMPAKYHLLVFSPSGSIIEYILQRSSETDQGTDIQGLRYPYGLPKESDARFFVEAIKKWDICHKRNRKDYPESVDFGGYIDKGDSILFQRGLGKAANSHPLHDCSMIKPKLSADECHHFFISQCELNTHLAQVPLWSKSGISLQEMATEFYVQRSDSVCGESELEKIPAYNIEARSKNLIPVFDSLQTLRYQQARSSSVNASRHNVLLRQKSSLSEDAAGRLFARVSSSSLNGMSEGTIRSDVASAKEPSDDTAYSLTDTLYDNHQPELVNILPTLGMHAQTESVDTESNRMEALSDSLGDELF